MKRLQHLIAKPFCSIAESPHFEKRLLTHPLCGLEGIPGKRVPWPQCVPILAPDLRVSPSLCLWPSFPVCLPSLFLWGSHHLTHPRVPSLVPLCRNPPVARPSPPIRPRPLGLHSPSRRGSASLAVTAAAAPRRVLAQLGRSLYPQGPPASAPRVRSARGPWGL